MKRAFLSVADAVYADISEQKAVEERERGIIFEHSGACNFMNKNNTKFIVMTENASNMLHNISKF